MVNKTQLLDTLFARIEALVESPIPVSEKLLGICDMLREVVPHYDWVGFYLVDGENKRELVLGPFAGEPTDHVRIPFGKGICGQAAERGETFVVQDISEQTNYLSCSIDVKSEIVLPMFKGGELIGELDIDSHQTAPFTDEDEGFLEKVAAKAACLL
ncbi:MAG: GAF domain-containing protein [candidate division Zixibacteria bacterium]|nr:GAF domain-containing protein [candidate division Zixibacteria bacterium]MBU1470697.1 GAF domain-containing protein [candidate division Zixibacteria bacterium]MBU2624997.1 GAF domain-containing protein [candidate division Zixibacteria bacterium]